MHIKLLRNTVADGQPVSVGQIIDVTDATGKTLVQMGKAQELAATGVKLAGSEGAERAPITVIAVEPDQAIAPTGAPAITGAPAPVAAPIAPPKPKGRKGSQR